MLDGPMKITWAGYVSWAWELNVSGALELGGVHLFFSDSQRDGIHMFSDRRCNAKYEYL